MITLSKLKVISWVLGLVLIMGGVLAVVITGRRVLMLVPLIGFLVLFVPLFLELLSDLVEDLKEEWNEGNEKKVRK